MQHSAPSDEDVSDLEAAELAVVDKAARQRRHPVMRWAGALSEIADQPPLFAICGATLLAGLWRRDPRLARTGFQMLLAETLATLAKGAIKDAVNRTRPNVALEEGRYEMRPGKSRDGRDRSFPSGHTAGAVSVAMVVAGNYPAAAVPAYGLATAASLVQVPRGKHYPSDLLAGLLIGVAAGAAARCASRLLRR